MTNDLSFRILHAGVEIDSCFHGFNIRFEGFTPPHDTAAFVLNRENVFLRLVCFDCWPIPPQREWAIGSLKFEINDDSERKYRISDKAFLIVCNGFFITDCEESIGADIDMKNMIFCSWRDR